MEWKNLKPRERKAVLLLGAAAFFGLYMRYVERPVSAKVSTYKSQIQRSEAQLRDLGTKEPQDAELSMKIQGLEEEVTRMGSDIEALEKRIPSRYQTTQLVGELTRLATRVKLESIKQKVEKEQTLSRIYLEVTFNSGYEEAVDYVSAVESISPFIRIEQMDILEPSAKSPVSGAPVRLLVSTLLTEAAPTAVLSAGKPRDLKVKRDILTSSVRPMDALADSKFELQGITFDPQNPTAIINGDVFKVDSEVGGYKVKKIMADSVILTDGIEDHLLSLRTMETA